MIQFRLITPKFCICTEPEHPAAEPEGEPTSG